MVRLLQGDRAQGEIRECSELAHRLPAESELFPSRFSLSTVNGTVFPHSKKR